jgi:hypothetical protein
LTPEARTIEASGSIPLPPMPLKKTGESIIAAALLGAASDGQQHPKWNPTE